MTTDGRGAPPEGRKKSPHPIWLWGPVAAHMAAIFVLSDQPTIPSLPGGLSNHTGHLLGYGLLAGLLLRALASAPWEAVTWRAAVGAFALAGLYGVTDEWHQSFVPGRTSAVDDWVADLVGAAMATAVGLAWSGRRWRRSREV